MSANILVVDDVETNIKLLEIKLLGEYYNVFTANNGTKALQILKSNKIDVILLDIMMPHMDGFEVCRRIKNNPETAHIPVIMVTALSDIEDRIKGLEAGADEFLTKPIADTPLLTRVKSLSRMKAIIDELKLRNETNAELGESVTEITDNFASNKILLINDDILQTQSLSKAISKLCPKVRIIKNSRELDILNDYIPDLVIISGQLEAEDPLRISVMLKSRENFAHTVLMLLIEDESMTMVAKGMELGINDYFAYPVDENELIARLKTQLRRKKYQDQLRDSFEQSVNLYVKDGLTGVFNRRYFDLHIKQMIKKATDNSRPLCMMMFDIDHFKIINDTYGHQAGDEILKTFTNILKDNFRITDLISRYGGEEFAVLLRDTSINEAAIIATRVKNLIENTKFQIPYLDVILKITASIGIAKYNNNQLVTDFIREADDALYDAKESGRNRIIIKFQ